MSKLLQRVIFKKNVLRHFRFLTSLPGDEKNVVKSKFADVHIPDYSVSEMLFENTSQWADKIFVECERTGKKYTHEQIREKSRNFGNNLRKKLQLKKGDVLAVLMPNVPDYGIVVVGGISAGLVVTTVNPNYTANEIATQLIDSSAKVIVTLVELFDTAQKAVQLTSLPIKIITTKFKQNESVPNGAINFFEFSDEKCVLPVVELNPNDVCLLPYSSGTTGLPKGVQLTHRNIVSNCYIIGSEDVALNELTTANHQDILPAILPMYHIFGLTCLLLNSLRIGVKLITVKKFTSEVFISVLSNHQCHVLLVVPPLVNFLTNSSCITPRHVESARTILSGAAPLGANDEERFLKKFKHDINVLQGYGLTETSPSALVVSAKRKKQIRIVGSVGEVVANTMVKVTPPDNPSGEALGPHQQGELLIKGPQLMKGYLNKPEATANSFHEGWFKTGDLVYYDENNQFYVTDRLKELIKVKAFQVAPAELEDILRSHPQVSEAAVVGIPHEEWGEVPKAFVVPKDDAKLDIKQLRKFVDEKVAGHKQLKGGVQVLDSIPKTASGKILRRDLRNR